jgi:hypothetical protein
MNLPSLFDQELTKLGGSPATLTVNLPPWKMTCDVAEQNSLAVSFNQLRLETAELAAASAADLKRISESLAGRLTYLMEPISPVEIDAAACVVQLRSNPPQKDDDGRSYYELVVRRGGELALRRYRKEPGAARRPISATVTREVLLRLVGDFNAAIG